MIETQLPRLIRITQLSNNNPIQKVAWEMAQVFWQNLRRRHFRNLLTTTFLALFIGLGMPCHIHADAQAAVTQWNPIDLVFTDTEIDGADKWDDFPLQVTFTHPASSEAVVLDGFWDGGNTWKARFAPTKSGEWTWSSSSSNPSMDNLSGTISAAPPTDKMVQDNQNYRGHIRISANNRYFEYADGTPFFLVGDTIWAFNTSRASISGKHAVLEQWLADRKLKKFNALLIDFLRAKRGGDRKLEPNEGGRAFADYTATNTAFRKLNPRFFQYTDKRIQRFWEEGFVLAAHPAWYGKVITIRPPRSGDDAKNISRYIMSRYGAYNMIWSLSGEYQYSYDDSNWYTSDWEALGNAVSSYNSYRQPLSVHPSGRETPKKHWVERGASKAKSSSVQFHNSAWLDHNWVQTGQEESALKHASIQVLNDYSLSPVKPVLNSEGYYEGHLGKGADEYQSRWQAWVSLLSGAAGYGYGVLGGWKFYDPKYEETGKVPVAGKRWDEAMRLPGSEQFAAFSNFLASIEWWALSPHTAWLKENNLSVLTPGNSFISPPHMSAAKGWLYVAYFPKGNASSLNGDKFKVTNLDNKRYVAKWYNPRTNLVADPAANPWTDIPDAPDGVADWIVPAPPESPEDDWVLLIQSAENELNGVVTQSYD